MSDTQEPVIIESIAVGDSTPRYSHMPIKERALCDYWSFIDLLEFKGGSKNFGSVHKEMADFISQPQTFRDPNPNQLIKQLDQMNRRRLMLVPRGHLKSTLCSVGYVLWRIYRNPNIRICVATATKDLALQFVKEIKQYFEDDDKQENIWNNRPHIKGRMIPVLDKAGAKRRDQKRMMHQEEALDYTEAEDKKIVWRSDALQVIRSEILKEPTVLAASPGSNITGMHFDMVIMDDIINDDTVATEGKMEKTLEWTKDLESIIDPARVYYCGMTGGVIIEPRVDSNLTRIKGTKPGTRRYYDVVGDEVLVLGTRYCKHDYYEYLLDNLHEFKYVMFFRNIYKNGKDNTDGYIWEERFNDRHVEMLKIRMKAKRFTSQYLNSILADEDIILRKSNLRWIDPSWLESSRGVVNIFLPARATGDEVDRTINIKPIMFIDPAISQKKTADNTVIMVGGVDHERNLYILDYAWGKFLPYQTIERMFELADKWELGSVHVEVVAFQQVLAYMIKSAMIKFRPICVKEFRPKGEKKGRITSMLEPYFANQKVWLMKHMAANPKFMEEIDFFPQESVSDDFLDTMAMIVENCVPTVKRNKKSTQRPKFYNMRYGGSR